MRDDDDLKVRLLRAKSWIKASRTLKPDQQHAAFIFLWIAFNCLYGNDDIQGPGKTEREREAFLSNLRHMHDQDVAAQGEVLLSALTRCRRHGADLIADRFAFDRYWRRYAENFTDLDVLVEHLKNQSKAAEDRLAEGECWLFLVSVWDRLWFIRNQIFHGDTTFGRKSKGWNSLVRGVAVLKEIVPASWKLMRKFGPGLHVRWGRTSLPRWGSRGHPRWLSEHLENWGRRQAIDLQVRPSGGGYRVLVKAWLPRIDEKVVEKYISADMGLVWELTRKDGPRGWRELGIISGDPAN